MSKHTHIPRYLRIERLMAIRKYARTRRAKSKILRQRLVWRAIQERCRAELNWEIPNAFWKRKSRNPNDYGVA